MENKIADDIYRKLQKRLDGYSMGFPATDSGIEIEILKELFTEEDAGMFLDLSQKLETPEDVAHRIGRPSDLERCQMDAINMNDDELAEINLDRCIGCGLCVAACPEEAIQLTPKPESLRRTPPANAAGQMAFMAERRGIA